MNEPFRVKRRIKVYCISAYSLHCAEVKCAKVLPLFNKLQFFLNTPNPTPLQHL